MAIKCLAGVMILKSLAESIALCEAMHNQDIDTLAGDFIRELVQFSLQVLTDPDAFYHDSDKAGVIVNLIYENSCSNDLQSEWDELEHRLHTIEGRDELDNLLNSVVESVVFTTENINFNNIHSAYSAFYQFAVNRFDLAAADCRNTPRQKFKQAVIALNYELPGHRLDLVWTNRKNIYKALKKAGWTWFAKGSTGSWYGGVPF
jgi:hypothetical protein